VSKDDAAPPRGYRALLTLCVFGLFVLVERRFSITRGWVRKSRQRAFAADSNPLDVWPAGAAVRHTVSAAALLKVGLLHPVPQATVGDPEVRGDLRDGLLAHPSELNGTLTELRGMWGGRCGLLPRRLRVPSR
jgi:hypothetical protein